MSTVSETITLTLHENRTICFAPDSCEAIGENTQTVISCGTGGV